MTKEWNTKQKRICRGAVSAAAVLLIAAVLCVGAVSADGGTPKQLTDAELTGYNVLVVNDETGIVETKTAGNLGSYPNVYLLEDAEDWNAVAIDSSYDGKVLILGDNLNFSTTGTDKMMEYPFGGKIYGNGYLIESFVNDTGSSWKPSGYTVPMRLSGFVPFAVDGLYMNYMQMTNTNLTRLAPGISSIDAMGCLIGTIDGCNSTSSVSVTMIGCSVYGATFNKGKSGGLIGLAKGNSEKDVVLVVKHSNVMNLTTITAGNTFGGLIGSIGNNVTCTIFNCSVQDSWIESTGSTNAAGLIGTSSSKHLNSFSVKNCKVERCTIKVGAMIVGGLSAGAANITFDHCDVIGCNISSITGYTGGLISRAGGDAKPNTVVTNCNVIGCNVTGNGNNVGGLFGTVEHDMVSADNCKVLNSNVVGTYSTRTGGLVGGYNSGTQTGLAATFTNCVAGTGEKPVYLSPRDGTNNDYYGTNLTAIILTSCSASITDSPFDLTFPTKEQIQVFPASKLPYVYVTYKVTEGYVGVPYSESKVSVDIPYVRLTPFDKDRVIPIRGGYTLANWNKGDSSDVRTNAPVEGNEFVTSGSWNPNKNTVNYHNISTETFSIEYTFSVTAALPENPTRIGYTFNGWNVSDEAGEPFNGNPAYFTNDGKWNYTGPNEKTLDVYANWSVYSATNSSLADTGSAKVATFDNNANAVKSVAIQNSTSAVTAVAVAYEPNTAGPSSDGSYTRTPLTPVFNITLTGNLGSDNATVVFNLTTAELNGASPSNIYLAHKKNGVWEYLKPSYTQTGDVYTFTVTGVDSFSPFVPISMSAVPQQSSSSHSSSRNDGYSVWLQETAQPTPTPVPTAEPTQAAPVASPVKPQPTQTSASPAPFVGILAGLGAAAVLFGLRRT